MTQKFSILAILLLFSVSTQATQLSPCAPYSNPSHRNSEVTDRKNVWGGKFLDGYSPFDFSENPITVGIEVEFTVPKEIGRIGLAKIVQNRIKEELPGTEVLRDKNDVYYLRNGEYYQYDLAWDRSIKVPHGHMAAELKSPILRNRADINLFYKILEELRTQAHIRTSPKTEGVHVHVGAPEIRNSELAMIVSFFAAIEKQVYETFSTSYQRQQEHAQWTSTALLEFLNTFEVSNIKYEHMVEFVAIKTYGLNILPPFEAQKALNKQHPPASESQETLDEQDPPANALQETLEFRLLNGTVDYREIQLMVNFATEFIRTVRAKDPRLIAFLSRHQDKSELPFEELMEVLDLDLLKRPEILRNMQERFQRESQL